VEVKDNGIGIEPNDIDKVMLPFYSTKKEGAGTGLGLFISFGIIHDMSGGIEIQSERLNGTTIRIRIPVKKEITKQAEKK
jgi:signal transduction histidine kinase